MKDHEHQKKILRFWNRETKSLEEEELFASDFLHFAYENPWGKRLERFFLSSYLFNLFYGAYKKSRFSRSQVFEDIEKYSLDMSLFEGETYQNYSKFFLRKYKKGIRPFIAEESVFPAFAEGKYLGYEKLDHFFNFPLKGHKLNLQSLIGKDCGDEFLDFQNGPMLICRLCPLDYHYFHFPDDGKIIDSYTVHGRYHSVSTVALKYRPTVFFENERRINILETKNFGKLLYIEVGAMCVGKIIEDHFTNSFFRGEVKGHFDFGASTVLIVGEKNRWNPSSDILEKTHKGIETKIYLGTEVGHRYEEYDKCKPCKS